MIAPSLRRAGWLPGLNVPDLEASAYRLQFGELVVERVERRRLSWRDGVGEYRCKRCEGNAKKTQTFGEDEGARRVISFCEGAGRKIQRGDREKRLRLP